jgi:hypothetical protein
MMALIFRWLVSLMVWLSADETKLATEPARAAAAVAAARATMLDTAAVRDGVESVEAVQQKGAN